MNQSVHIWLRRAVWFMLVVAAGWVAYRFGLDYRHCRAMGSGKGACITSALFQAYFDTWLLVTSTLYKILYFVLP